MRPKQNFTKSYIESLKPEPKRYNVLDAEVRGLGIQVQPSGAKSFFHCRKVQGWPARTSLGLYPEFTLDLARGKAASLNAALARWKSDDYAGANPVVRAKKVPTLGDVLEHYVEHHLKANAKNPDHAVSYARWQFDRYLASWRNRPLGSLRRDNVRELHAEIAKDHGGVTANRTVTFLRTIINHAIHPDVALWDGVNVAKDPRKFLAVETGRDRTLKKTEFPAFLRELAKEPHPDLRDAVLLALFTGQRAGSLLKMKWSELDLRRGLWTVTTFKGKKKSKTGKVPAAHIVPLIDEALAVLRRRPRVDGSEWVFVGRKGALTTLKRPWSAFLKRTGVADFVFHDLRRTLATEEGESGASSEVIQKTLGHVENSEATRIYDRSDRRAAVRSAMTKATRSMLDAGKVSAKRLLSAPRPLKSET
jgi:integrase